MAATKVKAGLNNESSCGRDSGRTDAGSPTLSAGAASLTTNRTYTLDDLDTIATVGKLGIMHQIKTRFSQQIFPKTFSYSKMCTPVFVPPSGFFSMAFQGSVFDHISLQTTQLYKETT